MRNENKRKLNHFQVRVFMKLRKQKHALEKKKKVNRTSVPALS